MLIANFIWQDVTFFLHLTCLIFLLLVDYSFAIYILNINLWIYSHNII